MVQGSVAARLIRESHIPVLAVGPQLLRTKGKPRLKHIMVPLDGTKESEAALPVGMALAKEAGARVSLVRVMPGGAEFAYPAQTPLYDDAEVADAINAWGNVELEREQAAVARVKEGLTPWWGAWDISAREQIHSAVLGAITPAEALDSMAAKWEELRSEYE